MFSKQNLKNIAIWVILAVFLTAIFNSSRQSRSEESFILPYSDLLRAIESEQVSKVTIRGDQVVGALKNTKQKMSFFKTHIPPQDRVLLASLQNKQVSITSEPPEEPSLSLIQILISWAPMLLFMGVWIFFLRQMQGGSNKGMGFGRSRARLRSEKSAKITFDDVAGVDEAKEDLQEIVDFLKTPRKFQRLGGRIPKGVLLVGPPGTGKTLLARAIAGEASVPFLSISGSDFVEMFVGVGASRVRDMFEQAKKNAPCIIFVDEIDAVGRFRGGGYGGNNDERDQTLNQLLVEMDGFETNEGIILIAATNRPDVLDPALLRPGRFDRQITVPYPDIVGREKILKVHLQKVQITPDVDIKIVARGTPGFSGAELANLVNEAALLAARRNRRAVSSTEFEDAKDKVMMGAERRSTVMTEQEKRMTAYHEAGHAVVAYHLPASDPIHKATIIPRGHALGMVVRLPERDQISISKEKLLADIAIAMAGRVAEQHTFGAEKVTTGAQSDFEKATQIARKMVSDWGMSNKLGPMCYSGEQKHGFETRSIADETAKAVDNEVRQILDAAYEKASEILSQKKEHLELLANGLLEHETLTGEQIKELFLSGKIKKPAVQKIIRSAIGTAKKRAKKKAPSAS